MTIRLSNSEGERVKAINEAIVTGVSFLMLTVDEAKGDDLGIKYKHISKEEVILYQD